MSILEIRRHTMRSKPGQQLSPSGISLAKYVGRSADNFDLVVSSEIPRAIETARAMGFAVNHQIPELGILPEEIFSAVAWPTSIENISKTVNNNEACSLFAGEQASHWYSVLDELSEHQSALIVTHGGIIELGAIGFAPDANHAAWGDAIGYCEGFRFTQALNGIFCEVLRVPSQLQLIHN